MVVVAGDRAPGQQLDVRAGSEFGNGVGDPGRCVLSRDAERAVEKTAAEFRLFVGDENPRSGAGGFECGGKSGWSGAHDEHVAVPVEPVVGVGVVARGCVAQAGRTSQNVLGGCPQCRRPGDAGGPALGSPHEGLVVEAGRHEPTEAAD